MLADKLIEKDIYLGPISYIKNTKITEYDIKSAGFNIIREFNLINEEAIKELELLDKNSRTIAIGKMMMKNSDLSKELTKNFATVRKLFVLANNIQEEDILSIKKDAIFIIQKTPKILKFGTFIEFVPKNVYTSFACINGMEMYYSGYTKKLDIKNFKKDFDYEALIGSGGEASDIDVESHPLIEKLKHFLALSEKVIQKDLFQALVNFRTKYINRELPIEVYREIKTGLYTLLDSELTVKYVTEDLRNKIDISRNYIDFLMPFFSILL